MNYKEKLEKLCEAYNTQDIWDSLKPGVRSNISKKIGIDDDLFSNYDVTSQSKIIKYFKSNPFNKSDVLSKFKWKFEESLAHKYTKQQVIDYMIKGGSNPEETKRIVNKNWDYIQRVYEGQNLSLKGVNDLMRNLGESYKENLKDELEKYGIVDKNGFVIKMPKEGIWVKKVNDYLKQNPNKTPRNRKESYKENFNEGISPKFNGSTPQQKQLKNNMLKLEKKLLQITGAKKVNINKGFGSVGDITIIEPNKKIKKQTINKLFPNLFDYIDDAEKNGIIYFQFYVSDFVNFKKVSYKEKLGKLCEASRIEDNAWTLMNYVSALRRTGKSDNEILKLFKKDFPSIKATDEQLKKFIKSESYKEKLNTLHEASMKDFQTEINDLLYNGKTKPEITRIMKGKYKSITDSIINDAIGAYIGESYKKYKERLNKFSEFSKDYDDYYPGMQVRLDAGHTGTIVSGKVNNITGKKIYTVKNNRNGRILKISKKDLDDLN